MIPMYLRFVDPRNKDKSHIYEYVRGQGEMAQYRKGRVLGNKTLFDQESRADAPVGALKLMIHRGYKVIEYATLEDLEGELFMEAFIDF